MWFIEINFNFSFAAISVFFFDLCVRVCRLSIVERIACVSIVVFFVRLRQSLLLIAAVI